MIRIALIALFFWAGAAEARQFDPNNDLNIAAYIRGTFGQSLVQKEAFIHGDGNTPVDASASDNISGEIGMLFHLSDLLNLRVGAEVISPTPVVSAKGYNSSGQQLFTMNSQIFIFNPQAALEVILHKAKTSRVLLMGGAGYATVSLKNSYTLTSTGQTQFGVNSFSESATANDINFWGGFGYEFLFADRAMMMFEASYRYFKVNSLNASQQETTIAQTNGVASGSPILNMDGTGRHFDLSGAFVGLSIRFYLQ